MYFMINGNSVTIARSANGKYTATIDIRGEGDRWRSEDWVYGTIDEALAKVKEYYS